MFQKNLMWLNQLINPIFSTYQMNTITISNEFLNNIHQINSCIKTICFPQISYILKIDEVILLWLWSHLLMCLLPKSRTFYQINSLFMHTVGSCEFHRLVLCLLCWILMCIVCKNLSRRYRNASRKRWDKFAFLHFNAEEM